MRRAAAAAALGVVLSLAPALPAEAYRPAHGQAVDVCRNVRGVQTFAVFIWGDWRPHPRAPRWARICVRGRR